jgi:hypothetical protein
MSADELLFALSLVEADHRLVLDKVRALREAVGYVLDPSADARAAVARLRDAHQFFATQFEAHMEEEEAGLVPLLARQPGGAEVVARLRQDHAEIRRRREEFGNCLQVAAEVEDDLTPRVVRDLLAYGWELWEMLDRHAHAETVAVYQCARRLAAEAPAAAPA